jgi:hypothetical protein
MTNLHNYFKRIKSQKNMKIIQKFKLAIIGRIALILTVGLNVRYALNNYGILDNKLLSGTLSFNNSII